MASNVRKNLKDKRFYVFTMANIQVDVFWVATQCSAVVMVNTETAWASDTLVPNHNTIRHHNSEDPDMNMNDELQIVWPISNYYPRIFL